MAYRNPAPTVDIIIELIDRPNRPIILIERLNPPLGWAIPGGFVDYGESVETAAIREAKEEIGLDIKLLEQFHVYSDPSRDERKHTISIVFLATATGEPTAGMMPKTLRCLTCGNFPMISALTMTRSCRTIGITAIMENDPTKTIGITAIMENDHGFNAMAG